MTGNHHKDINDLFKSLIESEDDKEEKGDGDTQKTKAEAKQQLNNLNCLLCINRMFVVLCIKNPPKSGLTDEYLYYGLCNTSNIVSILDRNVNELYIYGILSHDDNDNIYKIRNIIGVNNKFICPKSNTKKPKQTDSKHRKLIDKIQNKLLSINCSNLVFTI